MRAFVELYNAIDATTATSAKVAALAAYFRIAPAGDAAWAVYFLTGRKLQRLIKSAELQEWARERAGIDAWLFEESYAVAGDLAETVALLVGQRDGGTNDAAADAARASGGEDVPLREWIEERLLPLRNADEAERRARVTGWWATLSRDGVFILTKMMTGSLRVGVAQTLVERALAEVAGVPAATMAHRLMGAWKPTEDFYRMLMGAEDGAAALARPYPFFLASPVEVSGTGDGGQPEQELERALERELGARELWQAEWKWDGIRAQVIRRGGRVFVWSRGEENITERFPEITDAAVRLPEGTVLDGEVVAWRDGKVLAFGVLQQRIGRQTLTPKVLREAPTALLVYDVLEAEGVDVREKPLAERRALAERLVEGAARAGGGRLLLSPVLSAGDAPGWAALARRRAESRARGVEGLMLKRLDSPYRAGRVRGDWWKWKIAPFTLDMVLVYAQPGHGRRANLLTDYTFAVWDAGALVPLAKAYSGLTDAEIAEVDRWIRQHTTERFGPVRAVHPLQVFELGFEGIAKSTRHKCGIAVRFPRILRWRKDKKAAEADTLEAARRLMDGGAAAEEV